jgi:Flp pilus assembly protein TadD
VGGDNKAAIVEAEELVKLVPDHSDTLANLAVVYMANERFADAEAILRHAISADPKNGRAYHQLGMLLEATETDEGVGQAAELFQKAIQLDPENWKPRNDLGLIHLRYDAFKNLDAGFELISQAVDLAGDVPDPKFNLALALAKRDGDGDRDQAMELCSLVKAHPQSRPALQEMATGLLAELQKGAGGGAPKTKAKPRAKAASKAGGAAKPKASRKKKS